MLYLTTHSTHFIYGHMASDILLKDHIDKLHGLVFPISSKGSFMPTDMIQHTTVFIIKDVEHWLKREIAQ